MKLYILTTLLVLICGHVSLSFFLQETEKLIDLDEKYKHFYVSIYKVNNCDRKNLVETQTYNLHQCCHD